MGARGRCLGRRQGREEYLDALRRGLRAFIGWKCGQERVGVWMAHDAWKREESGLSIRLVPEARLLQVTSTP